MNSIDLMIEEHKNIKRMLIVVRKACFRVLEGEEICYEDFTNFIAFIRNYADAHHHGKEEKMLFNRMVEELGGPAEKVVKFGMLVEHDQGRLFVKELEEAINKVKAGDKEAKIDVIANAVSYTNLLQRHIDKEDNVVYTFANRSLNKETIKRINEDCIVFENEAEKNKVQETYIKLLEELEAKYIK
ncbi:Hemerythrin-like domain-containing protein [Clostridium cavendishii DSM 21758]|uniref:Hemerythrin-like domain-containing protein n=1 Tax=Clostridium cavendishii DSM 21758 TaxID=1121302 RepID=A0A1M6QY33_9CLOT|nr:hemerythrin domain-containing protein [Clostridium cavendishii]SHK25151.1 Hemerythrin-like domain-containing protein [Clostridium cavendishii DSM 21758]